RQSSHFDACSELPRLRARQIRCAELPASETRCLFRPHSGSSFLGVTSPDLCVRTRDIGGLTSTHCAAKLGRGFVDLTLAVLAERLERILRARHEAISAVECTSNARERTPHSSARARVVGSGHDCRTPPMFEDGEGGLLGSSRSQALART